MIPLYTTARPFIHEQLFTESIDYTEMPQNVISDLYVKFLIGAEKT